MSTAGRTVDVAALIEARRLSWFNYRLIVVSWLITVFDGLDMMMVSFAAPYMRDELHLTTPMLGEIFSAGTAGMVVGGLIFSYLGDRIGRRPTVIVSAILFGLLTIATGFARTHHELMALRFVDGMAIGGMLPLAWALNIEFVPKRMRATVVTVIMMGYSVGSASAAPMTNFIAPRYGWEGVYFVGGIATLLCALPLFILPESIRFLVSKGKRPDEVARILKRMDPTLDVSADDHFILGDEEKTTRQFHPRDLFKGDLKLITPLIWLGYLASSLAIYFSASWGPLLLESLHTPRPTAALLSSLGGLLGAVAGLLMMRFTDRRGPQSILLYPAIAAPVLLVLGFGLVPEPVFLLAVLTGVTLIAGEHSAMISITGIYYPSAIRASGGGWAASVGKFGGVLGPLLGAAVLSSGMPMIRAYAVLAIFPAVLFIAIFLLAGIVNRRQPDEAEAEPAELATVH